MQEEPGVYRKFLVCTVKDLRFALTHAHTFVEVNAKNVDSEQFKACTAFWLSRTLRIQAVGRFTDGGEGERV